MTIQPIGAASVCLYFTPADLSQHGFSPSSLTLEQALFLTRDACDQAGITLDGSIEIEAYPECCGVLVFANIRPDGPLWFTFDDLEPLLSAALALGGQSLDAALWWWEGRYWLALPPGAEGPAAVCQEFGASQPGDPLLPARLDESGRLIFPTQALDQLRWHFLRLHL